MSETQLVNSIQQLLLANGYLVIRVNSGAMKTKDKYGKSRFVRFVSWSSPDIYKSIAGCADIIAFHPMYRLAIEAKVGRRQTTQKQKLFLEEWRKSGGVSLVIRKLEELQPYLLHTTIQ